MKKPRKNYSEEFKRDAISMLTTGGYTLKSASENLGVSQSSLMKWKSRYGETLAVSAEEQGELKRLKEENRRLKMERDILKKAAAFFAKESC